jgi:HlyD family secretion protein
MKMPIGKKIQKKMALVAIVAIFGFIVYELFFKAPFLYSGTLEATKVDLSARLPAAIAEVQVEEGDRIKPGEVVITLSCEDFKIAAHLARNNYERNLKLLKSGFTSPETVDTLKTQMDDAETRVNWCTILSPIHGKVLDRYHEPGEWMSPGTKILTVANVQDIWAYIYVPEPKVASLSLGMQLKAKVSALNNREFEGVIIKINDEAEFTPKNVQTQYERERLIYGVKVSFNDANADEILKPGMTIDVMLPKH